MQGVAYTLYNAFFSPSGCNAAAEHPSMAPMINFARAHTREQLVQQVRLWLQTTHRPVVIKPQGTGCGHGIEFFFGAEPQEEVESKVRLNKRLGFLLSLRRAVTSPHPCAHRRCPPPHLPVQVDASISTVRRAYNLECGGLPHTVCEFLNTAAISDTAAKRHDGQCETQQPQPHPMAGHKFELRIVVYRDGEVSLASR